MDETTINLNNSCRSHSYTITDPGALKMGKRKVLSESYLKDLVLPEGGQLLGRVIKLVGRVNNIVLVSP